jgi:hypothetical protein
MDNAHCVLVLSFEGLAVSFGFVLGDGAAKVFAKALGEPRLKPAQHHAALLSRGSKERTALHRAQRWVCREQPSKGRKDALFIRDP